MSRTAPLLEIDTVVGYLVGRGLLDGTQAGAARVHQYSGGVSGIVLGVDCAGERMVVKQALPQLRTAARWLATPDRAQTEAAAIALLHGVSPEHTPGLLDTDPIDNVLMMSAAPAHWRTWKSMLLQAGPPSPQTFAIGAAMGRALGGWHRATTAGGPLQAQAAAPPFLDPVPFEQLRIDPFHRTVQQRHPVVADAIATCVHELLHDRECLVHGDFSPKNVVVGDDGWWMVDFEVAHLGASVFDLAFLLSHLMLKAAARPARAAQLRGTGEDFLAGYRGARPDRPVSSTMAHQIACLLLARVDGTSPVDYLDSSTVSRVRDVALQTLRSTSTPLAQLWAALAADR